MAADTINAAGATFPDPIYQKWFGVFKDAHPEVQINYQPIGSGGGIRQLIAGTVDFGASDMPMKDAQLGDMKVKPLHFPTVMGAVVLRLQHSRRDHHPGKLDPRYNRQASLPRHGGFQQVGRCQNRRPPTPA